MSNMSVVEFGDTPISIEDIARLAQSEGTCTARLSTSDSFERRIKKGLGLLDALLKEDGDIYGVTTGYGDSCTVSIPRSLVAELPTHLTRFHGCGMGAYFNRAETRAIVAARLASISRGYSGVRTELLQGLVDILNKDVIPLIPQEGSVGASGDLTPLSYVAATLIGERECVYKGTQLPASEALARAGMEALTLQPKEGLAVMNGTAAMTGLACHAFTQADYLSRLASRITALNVYVLGGNTYHFDKRLFDLKPHPGQMQVAEWIREDLKHTSTPRNPDRLQDRYSLRCAPHVIGVLRDALPLFRSMIETELNGVNDNPIIDGDGGRILHGGHFYGGHIAFAMDSLKSCVANIADLLDRQLALLVDPKFNNGLPANLSGSSPERSAINHGFKAVQIASSAWTAEALKHTMPASVFSRSTECHNQDKVSMGTISARDCIRILELTNQVAAATLVASYQAYTLRTGGNQDVVPVSDGLSELLHQLSLATSFVDEDRPLEGELRSVTTHIAHGFWSVP